MIVAVNVGVIVAVGVDVKVPAGKVYEGVIIPVPNSVAVRVGVRVDLRSAEAVPHKTKPPRQ